MNKKSIDTFLFGFLTGILAQIIGFYLVLYMNKSVLGYTERSVFDFLSYLFDYPVGRTDIIPKLLSLSAIADLLLFFLYIRTNKNNSPKGVIGSVFFLGLVILVFKFIL